MNCPRAGYWLGCKFEPRYDKSEPRWEGNFTYTGFSGAERLDQLRQITYVRDVCVRCGSTIERKAEERAK